MQNCGVSFADDLKSSPEEIPSFCILHFEFCIIKYPPHREQAARRELF